PAVGPRYPRSTAAPRRQATGGHAPCLGFHRVVGGRLRSAAAEAIAACEEERGHLMNVRGLRALARGGGRAHLWAGGGPAPGGGGGGAAPPPPAGGGRPRRAAGRRESGDRGGHRGR